MVLKLVPLRWVKREANMAKFDDNTFVVSPSLQLKRAKRMCERLSLSFSKHLSRVLFKHDTPKFLCLLLCFPFDQAPETVFCGANLVAKSTLGPLGSLCKIVIMESWTRQVLVSATSSLQKGLQIRGPDASFPMEAAGLECELLGQRGTSVRGVEGPLGLSE